MCRCVNADEFVILTRLLSLDTGDTLAGENPLMRLSWALKGVSRPLQLPPTTALAPTPR